MLGPRRGLDLKKPPDVSGRELLGRPVIHGQGRDDVERRPLQDCVGVIQHHAMEDTPAPIVSRDEKLLVTQSGHRPDHVLSHGPERIVFASRAVAGLRRIAIAPKIRRNGGIGLGERGRDLAPGDMRLRMSMEQQRRAAPLAYNVDCRAVRPDVLRPEARKQALADASGSGDGSSGSSAPAGGGLRGLGSSRSKSSGVGGMSDAFASFTWLL